jgi:hypothetical protein
MPRNAPSTKGLRLLWHLSSRVPAMSHLPMATPVTALFQTDPKRRPSEYATATELTRGLVLAAAPPLLDAIATSTNPLYVPRQSGDVTQGSAIVSAGSASSESKLGPKDVENGNESSSPTALTANVLRRRLAADPKDEKRSSIILPGLRFPIPPSRVLVSFEFSRFLRTLLYNGAFPFSLPFVLALEGRTAAENMAFLISPMKIVGAIVW